MARLSLSLLGPFQVMLDDEPVSGFESNKARGLLAYLAVEANRPHLRETLAGLLWPNSPDRVARGNLRHTLSNLRQAIGDHDAEPSFLSITRDTIQFNSASDHVLDVDIFTKQISAGESDHSEIGRLETALSLYRGSFLEGLSISDTVAFEEWALFKREHLGRLAFGAFGRLAALHEGRGEYDQAQTYAWRQVELEPWDEEAHQRLMRLLALSGRRSAALAQFETCRRLLAKELGVEPAAETTRLYQQIRDGKLGEPKSPTTRSVGPPPRPPTFLGEEEPSEEERSPFVAREQELARLDRFLDMALAGQARVVFVTGGPGSGKTVLVQEFVRQAMESHEDLAVTFGNGNAYTGAGDPYLPFLETMGMLTGDVEARWAGGSITRDHAIHLWNLLPDAVEALVEHSPDLIDRFVPGGPLLARAQAFALAGGVWLTRLQELLERQAAQPAQAEVEQADLFEQYVRVLRTLAQEHPLVLVLDDLQWLDIGSINLLFHLGRRLKGSRILLLGAYRPDDVAIGRDGQRHPLEPVINEFGLAFGELEVDITQAQGQHFVDSLLNSEPNRLGAEFRETLFRHTEGHALFTVELLRGLQERGDLLRDASGHWVEGPTLDWETLPARVEAVIAERIGRLREECRATLEVASIEGEEFTAEVVAQVLDEEEGEVIRRLSGELAKRHLLVVAQRRQQIDGRRLSRYRFRHYLFQRYLYTRMDEVERAHLHEATGEAMERMYGEGAPEFAVPLARHFEEAGATEKAVYYMQQAGQRALRLSANHEAIAHFRRGLELLETLPDTRERAQRELSLQLGLAVPLMATSGYFSPDVKRTYDRAMALCQEVGDEPQLFPTLTMLNTYYGIGGDYTTAVALAKQAIELADQSGDPLLACPAHVSLAWVVLLLGKFACAGEHLQQAIDTYDHKHHSRLAFVTGVEPGVTALAWLGYNLWFLGYPDQALQRSRQALALARQVGSLHTLAFALNATSYAFGYFHRRISEAMERSGESMVLSREKGFGFQLGPATITHGWTLAAMGRSEEDIAQIQETLEAALDAGVRAFSSLHLCLLADALWRAVQAEAGLEAASNGLLLAAQTGEHSMDAELHRLRGELRLVQGRAREAEASFREAIEIACQQEAKSWELRAATSMSRLWGRQGKRDEARQLLAPVYDWFTEGFDTRDLQEAKSLLEELSLPG